MSYDIYMKCSQCKGTLNSEESCEEGGTYVMGGTDECALNVTYNYSSYYYKYIDEEKGIRWIYGRTGKECLPVLEKVITQLNDDINSDYWKATEGNAKKPLIRLTKWCKEFPEGIFNGD